MSVNYYSIVTYLRADSGSEVTFTIPFPYIRRADIFVWRNGVQAFPGAGDGQFEFENDTQLKLHGNVLSGDKIVIRRITRKDQRLAEYFNGAVLTEQDLNIVTLQLLYLIQEMFDYLVAGGSGDPPPGGPGGNLGDGDGNDPGSTPGLIDQIIEQLLNSQLFLELTTLIPLTDINAELIMSQILNVHERWGQDRTYAGLIRELDEGLSEVDTRFTNEITELVTENEARITQIVALQARMGDAEADIITVNSAVATVDSALTQSITVANARFEENEGRIGTIETTYATKDYAEAYVQQQLDARVNQEEIDGYINASQIIVGMTATANTDRATVSSVRSFLVGSGSTVNPDGTVNWGAPTNGSIAHSLSAVQEEVSGHSDQLSTEAAFRLAMASRFATPADADNPTAIAAALETRYRTYADSESASAQIATSLQANRQPIIFRETAPNPYTEPDRQNMLSKNFPDGTLWFKRNGNSLKPFHWRAALTSAPIGATETYGPFPQGPGMWIPGRDTDLQEQAAAHASQVAYNEAASVAVALGGRIDNLESVTLSETEVEALVETTLTTAFAVGEFSAVQAIAQRMTSYINADTGLLYQNWTVRMNTYIGTNTPVIAGFGLGMQTDLFNPHANDPVSRFIVMADQFAVIAPPPVGQDPLTGTVQLSDVRVPFIIDAQTGTVGIDGTLIVKGSLRAYDGVMARLTFTELNNDLAPVNPNGMRLVLPSGTNNLNLSTGNSPWTGQPQRYLMWAGSGSMNHNNATFYVDTDGNAKFDGEIDASNISGAVNNVTLVNEVIGVPVTSGASWTDLPGTPTLELLQGHRPRVPFATITTSLYGDGVQSASARLLMRYELTPNVGDWTGWQEVAANNIATPTGTALTLSGGLGFPITGRVQLKVQIGPSPSHTSHRPMSNNYQGTFIGVR